MSKHVGTILGTLLTIFVCVICAMSADPIELRLLGLLPMTGDGWSGGGACLPATQMAIEDVNANDNILMNYKLVYNWIDSKVKYILLIYIISLDSSRNKNTTYRQHRSHEFLNISLDQLYCQ